MRVIDYTLDDGRPNNETYRLLSTLVVLRSKSPDLVIQEIWGHLCCHYAIRALMRDAADHAQVDPDRVSCVTALRIALRSNGAAHDFSPSPR